MQLTGLSYLDADTTHTTDTRCSDLLDRWLPHEAWWKERLDNGVDPYCKFTGGRIGPTTRAFLRDGREITGINFASQDYLGLAGHPAIHQAARETIETVGVHSAGSSTLMGNTEL
jgi:7-keto-8-aminopelargonate synthetase-like enzyme